MSKLPYDDEQELDQDTLDLINGENSDEPNLGEDYVRSQYMANSDTSDQMEPKIDLTGQMVGRDRLPAARDLSQRLNELVPQQQEQMSAVPQIEEAPAVNPQVNNYENILKQLQSKRKDNNLIVNMARAGNQMAQALASGYGAKIGDGSENLNAIQKTNDQDVNDYQDQIKNQSNLEQLDPNSSLSKAQMSVISNMAKEAGVSLEQFGPISAKNSNDIMRSLAYIISNRNQSNDRQLTREQQARIASEKLQEYKDARESKLEEKKKLSDKQVSELTSYDNALKTISQLAIDKPKYDTGPMSSAQNTVAQYLGIDDSKKSGFKANINDQLAQYIKEISGAAASDTEREFLRKNLPNSSDNDNTFMQKLKNLESRLTRNRGTMLSNLSKVGKNVEPFTSQLNEQQSPDETIESTDSDVVKVISPSGKTGSIPKANLQKALSKGYKEVK